MAKLIAVCKTKDGFDIKVLTTKELDMNKIAKEVGKGLGWGFNSNDCEIFQITPDGLTYWVARRTNRGWSRVSLNVKNWDKYAPASWVKKVKSNPFYKE